MPWTYESSSNHGDKVSMGSLNTKVYMIRNNMDGISNNNGRTTVKGFAAAKQYSTTPMELDKNFTIPDGAAATPQSNSAGSVPHELSPPATTSGVVGAEKK